MALYRIISEGGAYLPRDPEVVRLDLGSTGAAKAYLVKAPVCELLPLDTEIDLPDDFVPGPHLLPLDAAAETAMAAYRKARPGASLDPTRSLPLGRDPMAARTLEQTVMDQLERMAADVTGTGTPKPDAKLDALTEAMTTLTKLVAQLAASPPVVPAQSPPAAQTPSRPPSPRKAA
jgi:hypothetical protein